MDDKIYNIYLECTRTNHNFFFKVKYKMLENNKW